MMQSKTNITPIIDCIDQLNESDIKILVVVYGHGGWLEPNELSEWTGLHLKTVKKSMKRPRVRQLIKRMDKKSSDDQLFFKQLQEVKHTIKSMEFGS